MGGTLLPLIDLHAERGITTHPDAGVAWSIKSSSKDSRTLGVIIAASAGVVPNPNYVDSAWQRNGGIGRSDDPNGPAPVPRNYTSGSSLSSSVLIGVSFGGSLSASGTPVLVPNASIASGFDVETDFTYSNHRVTSMDLGLTSSIGFHSGSGNIDSTVPILGDFNDSPSGGLRLRSGGGNNNNVGMDTPPIPQPTSGIGHSLGGSSSSATSTASSSDQNISMRGRMRSDGRLNQLSGSMRNRMDDALQQKGDDNVALTLRHEEVDANGGLSSTITSGRGVKGDAAVKVLDEFGTELGLDTEGKAAFAVDLDNTELDVGGSNGGIDFEFVKTNGWGRTSSVGGWDEWQATLTENELNRRYNKIDVDVDLQNITTTSGQSTHEGAYKSLKSDSYSGILSIVTYFPESSARSENGGRAFEKRVFVNQDSWSLASESGGAICSSIGLDGDVYSTGGSSGSTIESLSYSADAFFVRQFILPEVQDIFNDNRSAHYNQTIRSSSSLDVLNPNAANPTSTITGDDRVVVTGRQFHHNGKQSIGMPMVTEVTRDLATGVTTIVSTIQMMGMDDEGSTGPFSLSSTYTEPNWDPRNTYEAGLDGVPLPPYHNTASDVITELPPGYVYPTCNTAGKTWIDFFAGRRGDAADQAANLASGLGDGFTGGLSTWIRQNINPFGDYVDYESGTYVGGEILGTVGATFVNPTGIAAKGTAIYNLYNKYDDVGRCANLATKLIQGGCFIEGTLVTVSSLPGQSSSTESLWSQPHWLDEPSQETPWLAPERYATVATRTQLQVPIESLPIGSRVPTKNPNRWEVDPQPEPDQATWAKLTITVERSDGGIVDAELIRPRAWILENGVCAGRLLPLNLPELEVSGLAIVTSIDDCPPIASGEGSVVTARFVTREVHVVASVDVLGADGTVETITGTTIHPVWSVDRKEWVPLNELIEGETLQGLEGLAVVLSVTLSRVTQPVYNIEVHGEHVYQVGELGVVVHNACIEKVVDIRFLKPSLARDFADPIKLERMGAFDWSKYKPIELIQEIDGLRVQSGMTRIEAALRAGITKLPAKIFSE